MTWNAMTPDELCDVVDFWAAAPWPLSEDETQQLAVDRFGWTVEVDKGKSYLMNTVSNFTIPDVMTIAYKDILNYVSLRISDTIRPVTEESAAFLNDAFTAIVREGEKRWGTPSLRDFEDTTAARWDLDGGSRIEITQLPMGLTAKFETPQGAAVERKLGDR